MEPWLLFGHPSSGNHTAIHSIKLATKTTHIGSIVLQSRLVRDHGPAGRSTSSTQYAALGTSRGLRPLATTEQSHESVRGRKYIQEFGAVASQSLCEASSRSGNFTRRENRSAATFRIRIYIRTILIHKSQLIQDLKRRYVQYELCITLFPELCFGLLTCGRFSQDNNVY